jgi:hypothetical protein
MAARESLMLQLPLLSEVPAVAAAAVLLLVNTHFLLEPDSRVRHMIL